VTHPLGPLQTRLLDALRARAGYMSLPHLAAFAAGLAALDGPYLGTPRPPASLYASTARGVKTLRRRGLVESRLLGVRHAPAGRQAHPSTCLWVRATSPVESFETTS